jgi:hypothetical protein
MMSMRRKIKGKSPEEIRELKREELDQPVSIQDFEEAIVRQDSIPSNTIFYHGPLTKKHANESHSLSAVMLISAH